MARLRVNSVGGIITNNPLPSSGAGDDTLDSVELASLPVITAPDYMAITINPDGQFGNEPEIVYITAHTSLATTATISRAEEGTSAQTHPEHTNWIHGPTAEDWTNTAQVINTDGDPGSTIYVGTIDPSISYTLEDGDVWLAIP